jgi:carbonic anhydrase
MLRPALSSGKADKPSPAATLVILKEGNARFVAGKSIHPHSDAKRLILAGSQNQGDYAYATITTCSDSRVPVKATVGEEHCTKPCKKD